MFNTLRFRKVYFCDLWLLEGANWGNKKCCWYVIPELHYIAPWIVCLSVWGSKRCNVVSNLFVSQMFTCIYDECLWYLLLLFLQCCMSLLDRCVQSVYYFLLEGKRFIYCALFERKYVYIICKGEAKPRNQRHELWPMRFCMGSPTPHPTMFLCPKSLMKLATSRCLITLQMNFILTSMVMTRHWSFLHLQLEKVPSSIILEYKCWMKHHWISWLS